MRKICCFAGHSEIYDSGELFEKVKKLAEELITEKNVTEFWVGNYGKFDAMSARAIRTLKKDYPHVELSLVIPYLTSHITDNKEYYYMSYDNILIADIPEKTPKSLWIIKNNQYMVQKSEFLVCYVLHGWGGAAQTLEYAKRQKNIQIFNLGQK